MGWPGWEKQLCQAMGWKPTGARLAFFRAWAACEGGTAANNPLNTTEPVFGAGQYNSAGVRNYLDRPMGLAATMLTLRLPAYTSLRRAINTPGLDSQQIAARASKGIATWGTNPACVRARCASSRS